MLRFSLSTGTLYVYPLRLVFRWARAAGFDGVELVVNPEAVVRGGRAVCQIAAAEGVELYSVHPTVVPFPRWRERHGGLDRMIGLARDAEARLVVMHTPRSESLDQGEGLAYRQRVEQWQPLLAASGLRLAVENKAVRAPIHRSYALTPLDQLRAFADRYDLGLVLDTTHAGMAGVDLLRARQILGERLVNVHLSDMNGWRPPSPLLWAHTVLGQHRFPGCGDLPLAALLSTLAHEQYAGLVTLEVNPFAVCIWWPPAVRRRLTQAVRWMREATVTEQSASSSPVAKMPCHEPASPGA
jgi:sugar phosphate isomerase/epimerase